jgi:hypothetical protein
MTSEQATAEIARIRGAVDHPWHQAGHREHPAALERMFRLYQRAHSPASAEPARPEPGSFTDRVKQAYGQAPTPAATPAPPSDTGSPSPPPPSVFDDPATSPRTAAELDAVPPPALDPKSGLEWDTAKLGAVNAAAEREGLTAFVLEGRQVLAQAATRPRVVHDEAARVLQGRWGSAFSSKLAAAHRALDALPPEELAGWEARDLDFQPDVMEYMARVGEEMVNPLTPGGWRRLWGKYMPPAKGAR